MSWRTGLNLTLTLVVALAGSTAVAIPIVVNSAADVIADDGSCTLREAIVAANANLPSGTLPGECAGGALPPTVDTIAFAIPGAGVHTIQPTSALPAISQAVLIDGYTQPGAQPNTLAVGDDAVLRIEIDGSLAGAADMLRVRASGSTLRGLVINRVTDAIVAIGQFQGPVDDTVIEGNFFNTDPTGSKQSGGRFPEIRLDGSNSVIGGTDPAARNVFGGAGAVFAPMIAIESGNGNVIQGNYLGVDASGSAALRSENGENAIEIVSGVVTNTVIGGDTPGAGNVISAPNTAILLRANVVTGVTIQGNFIGVDATGSNALGGFIGISTSFAASGLQIGGVTPGAGNVMSGLATAINLINGSSGVVIQGNRIGTDVTGTRPIRNSSNAIFIDTVGAGSLIGGTEPGAGNTIANGCGQGIRVLSGNRWTILGNAVHSNQGLGISLGGGGLPGVNDPGDGDSGPNNRQNYPVITSAVVANGNVTLSGTLNSVPSTTYRLEFFANAACDATDFGEGETYLDSIDVTTDADGNASFGPMAIAVPAGKLEFTATATDPDGNTSEFSQCVGPHDHIFAADFDSIICGGS